MASVKARNSALNAIKRYLAASKNESQRDCEEVTSYLKLLEEQWMRFNNAQDEVDLTCGEDTIAGEEAVREQAETWYATALGNFKRVLKSTPQSADTNNRSQISGHVQLPKMELPSFSGDPTEWISFQDVFQTMIDGNDNLSKTQKMHYLRGCLKNEALQQINNLKICEANYEPAWDMLKARYNVLRVIVDKHMRAIFAIEKASGDSASAIKQVLDSLLQHARALKALGRPVQFWDDWLIHVLVSRLAFETRKQWELSLIETDLPTFEQLQTFLETRCRSLSLVGAATVPPQTSSKINFRKMQNNYTPVLHTIRSDDTDKRSVRKDGVNYCLYCNQNHAIYSCVEYKRLNTSEKERFIKQKNACFNCLSTGHYEAKCRSSSTCRICQKRHHTTLHPATVGSTPSANFSHDSHFSGAPTCVTTATNAVAHSTSALFATPCEETLPNTTSREAFASLRAPHQPTVSASTSSEKAILLATALVRIQDAAGRWQTARALFDNGSHASFISEACVQRLRLSRRSSLVFVTGIGSSQGGRSRGETSITLAPILFEPRVKIDVLILQKITNDLPTVNVPVAEWSHIQGLSLADPKFAVPGPIDILIGMDEMSKFLTTDLRKGSPGTPLAQNTTFGWVLFGRVENTPSHTAQVQHAYHVDFQLVRAVSKLWELDELPQKKHLTAEETYCENYFDSTHRRAADGRFIVKLPLNKCVTLGETRSIAVRSFLHMEKRFATNAELYKNYNAFMNELLDMGHMEPVNEVPVNSFYMPHHPVLKETSTTTKLRVVFNASIKSSTGYSLNDALLVGPQLQNELFTVLVRFRTHRYAITADVAKMYRQVYVAEDYVDFQRIVWRNNPSEPLQDYRLLRVTYGLASASHLAVKALQQTAKDASAAHPEASQVILQDFYMDDLLTGSSSEENLRALQSAVSEVLSRGGFELRKWATNCKGLVDNLPHATKQISHFLTDSEEVRALGLKWNTEYDYITFEINLGEPPAFLSKRAFLSDASKLFDPLGLIAPCTIRSKIWFQQIWNEKVDWDQAVPDHIAEQWLTHRKDLQNFSSLKLNRWLGTGLDSSFTDFHIFADASERAYAAVAYLRTIGKDGTITVGIVAARTKVAPLKSTSLPRLELCAAYLASKLARDVFRSIGINFHHIYAWTDSTIALAWLQGHPSRWSTFVANRVAHVQEILPPECWAHVRSECNPADCASRGVTPTSLLHDQLWWQGPHWLKDQRNTWDRDSSLRYETDLESRSPNIVVHVAQVEYWKLLTQYSSYFKLKRITAYMLRFINNTRAKLHRENRLSGQLSGDEITRAEIVLIKYTQNHAYSNEILICLANKPIPMRSNLLRLQPFLDKERVLRVGGRIKHADVSADVKHPIILPKNCPIAKLILLDIHAYTLHAGPQIMRSVLQRRFWVIGSRNLIRKIYHSCARCMRLNRIPLQQSMADLPISRTNFTRCFLQTAVDFAGPFSYKFAFGRCSKSTKGYISSFICMATGAMHLEFVGDLSSAAFLNAYKRFINRRGYCQHLHSDNGTNFVGAEKELRIMLQGCLEDTKVCAYFADSRITWHFNPPRAPHMGGYWETGIKRVKYHLKRALGDALLTFEEFSTLLTEVEACVNSRPLCYNSSDSSDLEILTPGHFIAGEPLKTLPEPEVQRFRGSLGQRWHAISNMRQHFWRRWHDEYLVSLQQRTKWFRSSENLEENDVVVVIDELTPPTKWKLARVQKCYPGTDGRVRVVSLKTANGECVRPIAKLCRLPTKDDIFSEA